jgi:hypothetical protein
VGVVSKAFSGAALALLLSLPAAAGEAKSTITEMDTVPRVKPAYPIPAEPNQVFYIERSSNSSTVIYCAKFGKDGKLDPAEPVTAYWRWYRVDGHIKPLNFIERSMAYGIKSVKHDGPNGAYSFKIAAMPERTLYIGLDAQGKPEVFGKIGERAVKLVYVYLEVDDHGLMPDVPELDMFGIDRTNGKAVREHINRR